MLNLTFETAILAVKVALTNAFESRLYFGGRDGFGPYGAGSNSCNTADRNEIAEE